MEKKINNQGISAQMERNTTNTGNNTGSGAQAVREAMRGFNVQEDEQLMDLFRVKASTISKRVNDAKKGRRALGVVAHGRFRVPTTSYTINVYVCVYEREVVEGDYHATYHTVAVEAYNYEFSQIGVETLKKEVNYCHGTFENALKNTINSVVFNYVNAWLEASAKAEEAAKAYEETVNETDNDYWDSLVAQTEKYLNDRLEECGMNALKLADALVEAYKNTDGAWNYGDVPTLALWVAFKAKVVNRLEALGDGAQTPAPGLENAAEKSSDNNGNPAPGCDDNNGNHAPDLDDDHDTIPLRSANGGIIKLKANTHGWTEGKTYQSNLGEVYVYAGRTMNGFMLFRDNGSDSLYAGRELGDGKAQIIWNDCDEIIPCE